MAKGDKHVGATDIVGNKEAKKESPALGKKLVDLSEKKGTITLVTPPSWFTNQDKSFVLINSMIEFNINEAVNVNKINLLVRN